MTTEHIEPRFEPPHNSSPTDHVLDELQLYGYRPFRTNPTRGRCRKPKRSRAPSPTFSTP